MFGRVLCKIYKKPLNTYSLGLQKVTVDQTFNNIEYVYVFGTVQSRDKLNVVPSKKPKLITITQNKFLMKSFF